ncbi:hypothetical protein VaNZ11_015590, partial [Volvox africanus]
MEQLWPLAQAQETTRLAVEQLLSTANRSRIHKQLCHNVAYSAHAVFCRLEAAMHERTGDAMALCSAAARLTAVVNTSRACVEQLGNPSRLRRLTLFAHPRKNAERVLADQCQALQEVAEEYVGLWTTPSTVSIISNITSTSNVRSRKLQRPFLITNSSLSRALSASIAPPGWASLDSVPSMPADVILATPRVRDEASRPGQTPHSPCGQVLSPQPSGARIGRGLSKQCLVPSPSTGSGEADPLRNLPFAQRSVRPSDGHAVQRLCFMRGAGGESAAVQLMVVLNRQVEVYSAALDSFHSDTPLNHESQQVTATALYEPTIDLITGHRGGSVLVYGRVGAVLSASYGSLRGSSVLNTATAAATAAQQAGVPLVVRLSRSPVTALCCVPAIELDAATVTAAAASAVNGASPKGSTSAAGGPAAKSNGSGSGGVASVDENNANVGSRTHGAIAATPAMIASGAIGSCTADDVLLFTGDAQGKVMAVRYSRVQPEVIAANVFQTSKRNLSRNSSNLAPENFSSPEVTGLLYRSGCLIVSTSAEIYSIRVLSGPKQSTSSPNSLGGANENGNANGNGEVEAPGGGGVASGREGSRPTAATTGGAAEGNNLLPKASGAFPSNGSSAKGALNRSTSASGVGGSAAAAAAATQGATLPQSTSVNLLSPVTSAVGTRHGASGTQVGSSSSNGGAATTNTSVGSPNGVVPVGGGYIGNDPIIRRGALSVTTALVDTFPFVEFDSCTALAALDWQMPSSSRLPAANPADGAGGAASTAPPGGSGSLGPPGHSGGILGSLGTPMTETTPLGFLSSSALGGTAPAAVANGNADGAALVAADSGSASHSALAVPPGRVPKFVSPRQGPWRLLSAHVNGQLLMWDVTACRLQLICAIGQPGPSILNLFTFPELGTMVELLSSGHIRVGPLPTSTLAPPINPMGNVPVWQFARATMRAHRGRLTAGAALANCVATGSRAGGVKIWSAVDLRTQAAGQGVAFLSPLPAAAMGAIPATSASGGMAGCADGVAGSGPGTSSGAAGASAAGGRSIDSTSPTTSGPYPLSDHYPLLHARDTERARGVGTDEGIPAGAPAVPSQMTLGQDTVGSGPPVHGSYPSNSGAFPPFSQIASGHTSLASHMSVPSNGYPFVPAQMQGVPGPDAFGSGYPNLPQSKRNSSGGAAPNAPVPVIPLQQTPGGSGASGSTLPAATPAAAVLVQGTATAAPLPPASPQRMAVPMPSCPSSPGGGHNLLGGAPLATATPFATATADSSEASPLQRSGGGAAFSVAGPSGTAGASGGVGVGPIEPFRQPLPNGLASRSEDSIGNSMSDASSVAGTNNFNYHNQYQNNQNQNNQMQKQPQRITQGLRPTMPTNGVAAAVPTPQPPPLQPPPQPVQQHAPPPQPAHPQQQPTALARGLERPAGDIAPPRNKGVPLTQTERAVMNIFTGGGDGGTEETLSTHKLPAVGPLRYKIGDDGVLETSQTDIPTTSKPGADAGPSAGESQLAMPMPHYPSPYQHYPAPPSPISRTPTPGATIPMTVVVAAQDPYGALYGAPYPSMPPPSTDALPQPPPHLPRRMGSAAAYGSAVASQAWSPQVVPFNDARLPPQGYPGASQGPASQLFMPAMAGSGLSRVNNRTSEYGLGPVQPPLFMPGWGQHVPGPQISNGRRNSNMSDLDMLSPFDTDSEPRHAFSTCDLPAGEVGLPVPPQVAPQLPFSPPPVVTPAPRPAQNPQLSQNCFIRPEDLRNVEQIGEGAEGVVYRGRWHHIDVAVKEMHPTSASFGHLASIGKELSAHDPASAEDLAGLIKEVAALIDLGQHPNIIRFIGICTSPPRIVTEYYKMGSLYSLLKEARQGNIRTREKLAWDKRLIMLKDIAAGMAYLHSRDYIHGDLRSPNVFVTEDQHLKIGDFGFARILGKAQNQVVPARLTNPRWQAPEVYDIVDPIATTAADVYSFGIIMYEMLTFRLPYDAATEDEVVKLRHTFDPTWRPHVPPDEQLPVQKSIHAEGQLPPLQAYKTLMMDCWAVDPANRPGFHKIAGRLNALCHWQWALSLIKRGLAYRQLSKTRGGHGGGNGGSADVTPTCMTPNSVSSPTASVRAAFVPSQDQMLNQMLAQVASSLQQDPNVEQKRLDDGMRNEQDSHSVTSTA